MTRSCPAQAAPQAVGDVKVRVTDDGSGKVNFSLNVVDEVRDGQYRLPLNPLAHLVSLHMLPRNLPPPTSFAPLLVGFGCTDG